MLQPGKSKLASPKKLVFDYGVERRYYMNVAVVLALVGFCLFQNILRQQSKIYDECIALVVSLGF